MAQTVNRLPNFTVDTHFSETGIASFGSHNVRDSVTANS